MQSITDEEKNLWDSSIQKNLILEFSKGTTLTNTSIYSESMSLEQNLCDENQLTFGRVSSAIFKVRVVATSENYVGQILHPKLQVDKYIRELGHFKVESCEFTSDKNHIDITAYDLLYDVINSDYKEWYNNLQFPMTLKKFRDSFFMEIGIVQIDEILPLDNINLQKNIDPSVLSGKDILEAICEVNGCCGTLLTNGRFKYVSLKRISTQLFPSNTLYPSNDLYPKSYIKMSVGQGTYVQGSLSYEDYKVKPINRLQIRTEENDVGVIVGAEEGNEYVIENNFLLQGFSTDELNPIANAILNEISDVEYTPTKVKTRGMVWMELGDYISVVSSRDTIRFPILNRSLSGITALFDTYEAKGSETYTERINGVHSQIKMLRGKSNVLERTLEETRSTITDLEKDVYSEIRQTEEQIKLKVSKGDIASTINQTAQSVKISASKVELSGYATFSSLSEKGKTSINGENITTGTISADRLDVNGVFAKTITATGTITGGTFTGGDITCNKGKIGGFTINSGYIYNGIGIGTAGSCGMSSGSAGGGGGNDDWIFWAGNGAFRVTNSGYVSCTNASVTGILTASSGSSIGNFSTDNNSIFSGSWGASTPKVFMCTGSTGTYTLGGQKTSGWCFGAGSNFGVTTDGNVYCSGGKIGGFDISSSALGNTSTPSSGHASLYIKSDSAGSGGTSSFAVLQEIIINTLNNGVQRWQLRVNCYNGTNAPYWTKV